MKWRYLAENAWRHWCRLMTLHTNPHKLPSSTEEGCKHSSSRGILPYIEGSRGVVEECYSGEELCLRVGVSGESIAHKSQWTYLRLEPLTKILGDKIQQASFMGWWNWDYWSYHKEAPPCSTLAWELYWCSGVYEHLVMTWNDDMEWWLGVTIQTNFCVPQMDSQFCTQLTVRQCDRAWESYNCTIIEKLLAAQKMDGSEKHNTGSRNNCFMN